jgi:3-hydroxyacyl-CoA dehydrogenase/3-hydroxy-2-methylbutyryl-CoA dehydrogenase
MVLPMARDLARYKMRVNAIAPGVFRKPQSPPCTFLYLPTCDMLVTPINSAFVTEETCCGEFPRRPGHPDEFAHLVQSLFENEMMNGAVIRQDAALRGAISID